MQCASIGQNIKSRKRPSVRLRLWTRMWRYLWTDLHQIWTIASLYLTGITFFSCGSIEVVYAHARPLIDRQVFAPAINVVFTKYSCFGVDYFNKMAV